MSRKVGIVVSLALALIFTLLIVSAAGKESRDTVRVARTMAFIPVGEEVTADKLEAVEVPRKLGAGLASPEEARGKFAAVSLVKGQYVPAEALDAAGAPRPGHVEVFVPVDVSSSAMVLPGQAVNVHIVNKDAGQAPVVLENVRVLHVVGRQGESLPQAKEGIVPGGSEPAAVGLEVPGDRAPGLVAAASRKAVYLTRSKSGP